MDHNASFPHTYYSLVNMRSPYGRYIAFLAVLQYVYIYILKPIIKRNYIQDQHENLLLFSFFSFFF